MFPGTKREGCLRWSSFLGLEDPQTHSRFRNQVRTSKSCQMGFRRVLLNFRLVIDYTAALEKNKITENEKYTH